MSYQDDLDRIRREGYDGQPPNSSRVLEMNESTSDDWDKIPFPARQQLGDHGELRDARSGNGVNDEPQAGFDRGGHTVLPVTYHLESTPPPSEPMGAPGSESYNVHARGSERMASDSDAGFDAVRHDDSGPISSQQEVPGRDERIAAKASEKGNTAPSQASTTGTTTLNPSSESASKDVSDASGDTEAATEDVPNSSMQEVLTWVGDDKNRARVAFEAEQARPTPRQTLLAQLQDKM